MTMSKLLINLQTITNGCREDMHEPSEQDLKARVIGDHLDNAFGEDIRGIACENGFQEFVVVLERNDQMMKINLASLIALARKAQIGHKDLG